MKTVKKNKLSIHLIKEEYDTPEKILSDFDNVESIDFGDQGKLYFETSKIKTPKWISNFFGSNMPPEFEASRIYSACTKAVFLKNVNGRFFTLSFGFGRNLIDPSAFVERFGLKVVLNLVDPNQIRSIDKKDMSRGIKTSKEHVIKRGNIQGFGIDTEQDLVQGVSGNTTDSDFGTTVTGKDSLSINAPFSFNNIELLLTKCLTLFESDRYLLNEELSWIDQITEVKDKSIVQGLDLEMTRNILNRSTEKVWMAIPEIVDWQDVGEFRVGKNSLGDDIDLEHYLSLFQKMDMTNIDLIQNFKKNNITCEGADGTYSLAKWKAYSCLYCEISQGECEYILSGGKWFAVRDDFATTVNKDFESIRNASTSIFLPPSKEKEKENQYNSRIAESEEDLFLMDRKLINFGGLNQKNEFCDLYKNDKTLFHVKRYGSSSVFSHLFGQGLISAELLKSEKGYRSIVNDRLPLSHKFEDVNEQINPSDYNIVFAVISESEDELNLPFFSKVNLRHARKRLTNLGFKVSIIKVSIDNTLK